MIIFHGKGRVTMDEKLADHKSINIFFQISAWIDIDVCKKWIDTTLSTFVKDENLEAFLLLLDNLSCQELDEFKEKVYAIIGLCWYGLKEGTDLWQQVDARYADVLKKLVGIQQRAWLAKDDNADRWYDGKSISAKECRILIMCHSKLQCWASTVCLLTADGSDDHLVKSEGLPNYVVPPPSLCEPINVQPVQPQFSAPKFGDEDDPDENEDNVEENTEFAAPGEDGNIFDLLNQY